MALTHPHLFERKLAHVEIETHGHLTAGMTIIDQRDLKEVPDAELRLAHRHRRRRRPGRSSSRRSPTSPTDIAGAALRRAFADDRSDGARVRAGMRAAVMRDWQLRVDDLPDPVPGPGQVLTKVLACGICGSDLHMLRHGEEIPPADRGAAGRRAGGPDGRRCSSRSTTP